MTSQGGGSSYAEKESPAYDHHHKDSLITQDKSCTHAPEESKSSEQSYTLEDFVEVYQLPQLVTVTEGHYGETDYLTMPEGAEIILFFKKKTQAVIATAQHTEEKFHIPLNCSLKFSPYQRDSREHLAKSYYYRTVSDLLNRRDGLPKVVKVLRSHKTTPILNANELIFPTGMSSRGKHLKFTDINKEEIRLKLTCDIGFSTNPSDTKMDLADYVEHINEFPSSVMVFCDCETRFGIHNGMEMVLQESKMLYSCICSMDVDGSMNYPLIELLTGMPIEVKAISAPTVSLKPIYETARKVYDTFDLSMVQDSMFVAHNDQHDYEEIRKSDTYQTFTRSNSRSINFYNLEMPAMGFTKLPPRKINPVKLKIQDPLKPDNSSTSVKSPPLPPRRNSPAATSSKLQRFFQPRKQQLQHPDAITDPSHTYTTSIDERRFYLRSFTVTDVLKLLDKMSLGQFKGIFRQKNVDGKALLSFTKYELEEVGITDSSSQKHLLDVISGRITYTVK